MSVGMWVIQLAVSKVFVTVVTLFTLLHKDGKKPLGTVIPVFAFYSDKMYLILWLPEAQFII